MPSSPTVPVKSLKEGSAGQVNGRVAAIKSSHQFVLTFARMRRALRSLLSRSFQKKMGTGEQAEILLLLFLAGPKYVAEIGDAMGMERSSASRDVSLLVHGGLAKSAKVADGRRRQVLLTPLGKQVAVRVCKMLEGLRGGSAVVSACVAEGESFVKACEEVAND
jgi:DNA-binding MarR family transcriptional regulator